MAWQVVQQPTGTYTPQGHSLRVAPLFAEPVLAYLLYYIVLGAMHLWDNRDKRRVEVLNKKLRKMVAELKVVCAQPSPMTTSPSVAAIVSAVHALAYHIQHLTLLHTVCHVADR